jgi:hypothetical protein
MKKSMQRFLIMMICLGVMALMIPSYSAALDSIQLGEGSQLTFYGFFRNNTGMFTQNQIYVHHQNKLATERTWWRGYMDFKVSPMLRLWAVVQFVYEPEYWVEKGAASSLTPAQYGNSIKRRGGEYSEYRNINDILREALIEFKPNKENTIKIGRQIVIWGESLTQRVGDVIHPDNGRFTFLFANLEDTRIPSWMIRVIHDFPSINSSLDWNVSPILVQNKYGVTRSASQASLNPFTFQWTPGERFSLFPENRGFNAGSFTNYIPFGIDGEAVREDFPKPWRGMRGGFRTNTTAGGFNFGVTYFHTQEYNPVLKYGTILVPYPFATGSAGGVDKLHLVHPSKDIFGLYMNKSINPGVVRTEVIYIPNQPFHTMDPYSDVDGVVRRNYIKYLLAYDLNGFFYFTWHKTASFDITFEHVGEWRPSHGGKLQWAIYDTPLLRYNPSFATRISTNWIYDLIETELIASWGPWGSGGFIMPGVKYLPPWLNKKISFQLQYAYIFARTPYKSFFGSIRNKDMAIFTTQIDW